MIFFFFISFIAALRIGELIYSRSNELWLRKHGAIEYGKKHYPFMIALHLSFFISLILEYYITGSTFFSLPLLIFFFVILAIKVWVISTLGKFWSTKIYRISSQPLVRKGIYKYVKHPNYAIVIAEIAIIPLIFGLYYTAVIFSFLNCVMLYVRIKEENKALAI